MLRKLFLDKKTKDNLQGMLSFTYHELPASRMSPKHPVITLQAIYGLEQKQVTTHTGPHEKKNKKLQLSYNQFKNYFLFLNRIAPTYSDP